MVNSVGRLETMLLLKQLSKLLECLCVLLLKVTSVKHRILILKIRCVDTVPFCHWARAVMLKLRSCKAIVPKLCFVCFFFYRQKQAVVHQSLALQKLAVFNKGIYNFLIVSVGKFYK